MALQEYYLSMQTKFRNLLNNFSLFLFFISASLFAQENSNNFKIDSLFQNYSNELPGISYAVIKNGEIIENQNFGLANLSKKLKSKNNTNYRLSICNQTIYSLSYFNAY